jgi:integrase/recombinase XerC
VSVTSLNATPMSFTKDEAEFSSDATETCQQYLNFLRVERRLSANTLQSYERDISQLLSALQNQLGQKPLAVISSQDIKRNLAMLRSQGLSPRSIARLLSAWRGFFAYALTQDVVTANPTFGLKPPKAAKTLPKVLSPEEAVAMASDAQSSKDATENPATRLRDHAMVELLYSSGLRVSELTNLNCAELDVSNALVRVTGKGNKTRIIPMGAPAVAALRAWLSVRGQWANNIVNAQAEEAVFITPNGQRLYPRLVQRTIKKWAFEKGISQNVHPHMLRHSFASHILQSSGDLRAVQEMLGHASITSTQVYTHLDFQHLAKVYDVAHPRARFKTK